MMPEWPPDPAPVVARRLPADRGALDRRRPAHRRPGRHRRDDRLVLPGPVRRAVAVRRAARCREGRPLLALLPDTNILMTRFMAAEAVGELIDFMVPVTGGTAPPRDLLAFRAHAVPPRATFEPSCHPAFDYAR